MGLSRLLLSSISLLLPALPQGVFASGLEAGRSSASALFDGSRPLLSLEGYAAGDARDADADFLRQMREVLSTGAWDGPSPQIRHFMFKNSREGWTAQAQSVGLEGFLWTKKEL
ncbi:MAG: hypothetical protein AAB359_00570 [Elusimicrobiota bacterium]